MPAIIYLLLGKVTSNSDDVTLNFGVLLCYSCPKNCKAKDIYIEEHIVVQDL